MNIWLPKTSFINVGSNNYKIIILTSSTSEMFVMTPKETHHVYSSHVFHFHDFITSTLKLHFETAYYPGPWIHCSNGGQ